MPDPQPFNAPVIVDSHGKPARLATSDRCPQCGSGPELRVKSGMGDPHPVCRCCGYEWSKECWND